MGFIDLPKPVGKEPGNQSDTQLQDKCLGRIDHIDGIKQIANRHTDGPAQAAVYAAQQKRSQYTDRISQMNGRSVASRKRNFKLQERENNVRHGRK